MNAYLTSSEFIDWEHPLVSAKAKELSRGMGSQEVVAGNCFEYVRDMIRHSRDYALNPVTCRASEVLFHKTGYCYAKATYWQPCYGQMESRQDFVTRG